MGLSVVVKIPVQFLDGDESHTGQRLACVCEAPISCGQEASRSDSDNQESTVGMDPTKGQSLVGTRHKVPGAGSNLVKLAHK